MTFLGVTDARGRVSLHEPKGCGGSHCDEAEKTAQFFSIAAGLHEKRDGQGWGGSCEQWVTVASSCPFVDVSSFCVHRVGSPPCGASSSLK